MAVRPETAIGLGAEQSIAWLETNVSKDVE